SRSAARAAAILGSSQPASGSKVIVDGRPPSPHGLNTQTGPRRARQAAVRSTRSVRVLVATTAPQASRIRHANPRHRGGQLRGAYRPSTQEVLISQAGPKDQHLAADRKPAGNSQDCPP